MCHSESDESGCFSKSVGNIKDNDQVHIYRQWSIDTLARGCVELLPRAERETCLNKISNLEGREDSNSNKDQHFDYNNYLPKGGDKLRCCQQNMCNYEIAKPIIIRELDESEVSLSPERGWLQGLTIGVSVLGIVVLIFLIAFAGKILTASDEKSRSSELLNELSSRDFYINVPYFIERSPSSEIRENGKSERCSILCVKSLQKNIQRRHAEDVADYCRFHPLSLSSSNRHSFSCPSSLAILPPTPSPSVGDDEGKEELQPLKRDTEDLTEATLQEL
ncbi:hypothetical protein Avbf_11084 [Armadillidium vulgare]|nr:hypothetical protein Avbf_11084 [Armadillidium vulgare]